MTKELNINHERCKICQWNKDGHTTPETCRKMCNYRYDYKRRIRICDLENKVKTLTEENNFLKEEVYKKSEQNQSFQAALEEIITLRSALQNIKELNEPCADCKCNTACGVCSIAEGKPYGSYHIANEVLKQCQI